MPCTKGLIDMNDPKHPRHEVERRRPRYKSRPMLEGLEPRNLLSAAGGASAGSAYLAVVDRELAAYGGSANQAHVDSSSGLTGTNPAGPFLNPTVIRRAAEYLYGSGAAPTKREINRQTFTARWVGQYTIGPPRFSDREDTIHLYGTSGGSNQFLKGKFNIALFPPADPGATPTVGNPFANQVTGVAALIPQNYLQSGSMLVLDLNGTPAANSDPSALPTQLTWTYDNTTSAGAYAAPAINMQGTGTLTISYQPDAHPIVGTLGSGKVIVTFQGLINANQIVSAVSQSIS
jgi:hypothetical protein